MNFRNKYSLNRATEADAADVKALYEAIDFDGKINVQFLRNPDVLTSLKKEGEELVLFLLRDTENGNRAVMLGGCIIRTEYVSGEKKRIGYLTGLKIVPEYRHKITFIPALYTFLWEQTRERVDLYYSTILKDNIMAQRLLEKKHVNMPYYYYHQNYTVYLFCPSKSRHSSFSLEQGLTDKLKTFYRKYMSVFDFSPLAPESCPIPDEQFFHLHDENGEIVAACAIWNQQEEKQYVVFGYKGFYKIAPFLPAKLLGYPTFPKKNTASDYLSVTFLRAKDNDAHLAEILIRKVGRLFRRHDFLMLGLHETNPFNAIFKQLRHIKYQSRFYTVSWDGEDHYRPSPDYPIGLEVGLL